jgi:SET domain-containing protein
MANQLVKVKRSGIGLGLFAADKIAKDTRIIEYTGEKILRTDRARHKGKYLFTLNDKWTVDGKSRANIARYANHSCRPNAKSLTVGHKIWIIARRRIRSGEEITFNYGKEYFNQFIKPFGCKCAKCKPQDTPKN